MLRFFLFRDWQQVNGLPPESLHVDYFILHTLAHQKHQRQSWDQYTVSYVRMTCLWLEGRLHQILGNLLQLLNMLIWRLMSCQFLTILLKMVIEYIFLVLCRWKVSVIFVYCIFTLVVWLCCRISWMYFPLLICVVILEQIKILSDCWLWRAVLLLASCWSHKIVLHIYSRLLLTSPRYMIGTGYIYIYTHTHRYILASDIWNRKTEW